MNKFLLKELEAINTRLTYLIKDIKEKMDREDLRNAEDYRNVDSNGNYISDEDC